MAEGKLNWLVIGMLAQERRGTMGMTLLWLIKGQEEDLKRGTRGN